jgi:hypothetical protein
VAPGAETGFPLEIQVNIDKSTGSLGELAYRWFDEMSVALAPAERAALAGGPARVGPDQPGTVYGTVGIHDFDPDGSNRRQGERNASAAGMRWLHRELLKEPRYASLSLDVDDEPGRSTGAVSLKSAIVPKSPNWLRLSAYLPDADFLDPVRGSEIQRRYLDGLWSFVDDVNPGFGHIAYLPNDQGATPFEVCLRNIVNPNPREWWDHEYTVNNCREFLRGYSWLTIIPAEIAVRLGGVDTLAASGAFAQVRALSRGGIWLLATDDYRDYTDEAIRRVFTVVAPALRHGPLTNWPRVPREAPFRIVFEDAAEVARR